MEACAVDCRHFLCSSVLHFPSDCKITAALFHVEKCWLSTSTLVFKKFLKFSLMVKRERLSPQSIENLGHPYLLSLILDCMT